MSAAVSVAPRAAGALASVSRRAAFAAVLAAAVLLPQPYDQVFSFPAVGRFWTLLPFAALMLLPLLDLRSPRLPQLDLVVLLSLLVALGFAAGQRPWWMLLLAPPSAYLAVRMLVCARRDAPADGGLPLRLPRSWLWGGIVVLCGVHIAWASAAAVPTDVGVASVRGALAVLHGQSLYGAPAGTDTYGPVTFEAFVPFAVAAHASSAAIAAVNDAARMAALCFTLLTGLLLFLLGRALRDTTAGVVLAFCWLAFPFSLYEDALGWNDSLLAAALVGTLLAIESPARRGALAAIAGWTKLSPLALVPLLAVRRRGRRDLVAFSLAFAVTCALVFAPALAHDGPATILSRTFGYQAGRAPVNSIWAALQTDYARSLPWLDVLSRALHALLVAIAVGTALLLPAARLRDDTVAVAAASAAVMVLFTLAASYFSFSYVLWYAPLVLVAAILGRAPSGGPSVTPVRVR